MTGWVIRIWGSGSDGTSPAGYDSCLVKVPGRWYGEAGGRRCLLAQVAGAELRAASEAGAAGVGEDLHHADWVITSDPGEVSRIGMAHDCPDCLAGTEAAVAWLRGAPGGEVREIAAGLLHWAGPPWRGARRQVRLRA